MAVPYHYRRVMGTGLRKRSSAATGLIQRVYFVGRLGDSWEQAPGKRHESMAGQGAAFQGFRCEMGLWVVNRARTGHSYL
ncbi:MAG TPA: hypothetical protein PLJ27_09160 [Polyangiaceae bacterium]|nr:hypothetical protein [Polyangiaceae bacterium]